MTIELQETSGTERAFSLPDPLRFSFTDSRFTPYITLCFPPGRHIDWPFKLIGLYLDELIQRGIHTLYMANVSTSNALFVHKSALKKRTKIGKEITVCHDPEVKADGVYGLNPGEAFATLTAGCTVNVIALPRGIITCFHGSRESWVNRLLVLGERSQKRRPVSVLHEAVEVIQREYDLQPNEASFASFFSIKAVDFPHPVDHEEFKEYNLRLPGYLDAQIPNVRPILQLGGVNHLDMGTVAVGLARSLGFADTGSYKPLPSSDPRGFATTAAEGRKTRRRNLAIVYCPAN